MQVGGPRLMVRHAQDAEAVTAAMAKTIVELTGQCNRWVQHPLRLSQQHSFGSLLPMWAFVQNAGSMQNLCTSVTVLSLSPIQGSAR